MAWVAPVVGGLVSLGSSLLAKSKAKKAAKAANSVERLRLGMAEKLQDRYFSKFVPAQDRALEIATRRIDPNAEAGAAGADVQQSLANANGQLLREYGRRGISPNDPAAVDALSRNNLNATLGLASAKTLARRNASTEELSNLMQVSNLGAPLLGQASSTFNSIGADRNANANSANALAGQAAAGAGQSLADLITYFTKPTATNTSLNASQTVYPGQRVG